jgi:hypothetical protein
MDEIGPDTYFCTSCGCRADQLNIWEFDMKEKSPKKSKYKNKKIEFDHVFFDSEVESRYYNYLKMMKETHNIIDFELQPKFELQPAFVDCQGFKIRPIHYVGDFLVHHKNGSKIIVDVKGMEPTPEFKIKAKLFKNKYPEYILSIVAEVPKKYGGGKGVFDSFDNIKKLRKEAAKNGVSDERTTKNIKTKSAAGTREKKAKQTTKREKTPRTR